MRIFVDTSAWLAHFNRADEFHDQAEEIFHHRPELLTSNTVLHETVAHLSARVNKKAAKAAGDFMLSGVVVKLVALSLKDEIAAWRRLKKSRFAVSFVDITNVVLMEKLGLKEIFAFDKDFLKLGLKVVPKRV